MHPCDLSVLDASVYVCAGDMEVLHRAALRHVLDSEDASLGPWHMGRDAAEDELHAFAGVLRL